MEIPKKKQVLSGEQKERKRRWTRARYQILKEHKRKEAVKFYWVNREKILGKLKTKRESDPEVGKARRKARYLSSRDQESNYGKKWRIANRGKLNEIRRNYAERRRSLSKLRRAENPSRKISENCRSRVYNLVKRFDPDRRYKTFDLIGCTPNQYVAHLESLFRPGMSWENYGAWEIDHIAPLSGFDLTDKVQLYRAFHYANCQPLWKIENMIKGCKPPNHAALIRSLTPTTPSPAEPRPGAVR